MPGRFGTSISYWAVSVAKQHGNNKWLKHCSTDSILFHGHKREAGTRSQQPDGSLFPVRVPSPSPAAPSERCQRIAGSKDPAEEQGRSQARCWKTEPSQASPAREPSLTHPCPPAALQPSAHSAERSRLLQHASSLSCIFFHRFCAGRCQRVDANNFRGIRNATA